MRASLLLAAAIAVSPLSTSLAQDPATPPPRQNLRGLSLGLALNGAALKSTEEGASSEAESGGGFSVAVGYGFTPRFSLQLELAGATIQSDDGDYGLGHLDVLARYAFANPARALVPFIEGGFSSRAAVQEDVTLDTGSGPMTGTLEISGSGITFGAGLSYFIAPRVGLTSYLRLTSGAFDRVSFRDVSVDDLDFDAVSSRFGIGLVWYTGLGGGAR